MVAWRLIVLLLLTAVVGACRTTPPARLSEDGAALVRVDPASCRDALIAAWETRAQDTMDALERSRDWFERTKGGDAYPFVTPHVTGDDVQRSLARLIELLAFSKSGEHFADVVCDEFDLWQATGRDGYGDVLFTAYFAPEYPARRMPDDVYRYPLYRRPTFDPADGEPGPTRSEFERDDRLRGLEIAWMADPLDRYLVHVNGSAALRLADGDTMCVGHDGTNERPYTSLGRLLIDAGLATPEEMDLDRIRAIYAEDRALVESFMQQNDRYVYFRPVDAAAWPTGSVGVPLTPWSSIATDKSIFPPGAAALVETTTHDEDGHAQAFVRLVADQDRGGAIRGAGRADIFLGVGEPAGTIAGRQKDTGRMFYLLLRDEGL